MPLGINYPQMAVIIGFTLIVVGGILFIKTANKNAEESGFSSKGK